ncbi:MAG TPA: hypothetical protein ENJ52_13095 [Aliiroseovarius sp.]|nr:hypothetical protein [Aliiroseovarius sp.]
MKPRPMKPRLEVHLWSALRRFTDGREAVTVEAATIGEMLDALRRDWPGLRDAIDAGVSVSVDGRLIAASRSEPLHEGQEIYLLQRLKGG